MSDKKEDLKHGNPFSLTTFLNQNNFTNSDRCALEVARENNLDHHMLDSVVPSTTTAASLSEDNPFSFRRFLDSSTNNRSTAVCSTDADSYGASAKSYVGCGSTRPKAVKQQKQRFVVHSDLPDFVQDHFSGDSYNGEIDVLDDVYEELPLPPPPPLLEPSNSFDDSLLLSAISATTSICRSSDVSATPSLPDFALHGSSTSSILSTGSLSLPRVDANLSSSSHAVFPPLLSSGSNRNRSRANGQYSINIESQPLPDFVSDATAAAGSITTAAAPSTSLVVRDSLSPPGQQVPSSSGVNHNTASENLLTFVEDSLKSAASSCYLSNVSPVMQDHLLENSVLRRRVIDLEGQLATQSATVDRLRRRLAQQETRETEETAAMELMLKQVEANLDTAQKRATLAESSVAQLCAELQTCRAQLAASLSSDVLSVDARCKRLASAAAFTGAELRHNTVAAVELLKQLRHGTQRLALMADHLCDLERFEDCGATTESVD